MKGFLLAYLELTKDNTLLPEYESVKRYADFYGMQDLEKQPEITYNYRDNICPERRFREITELREGSGIQLRRYT